MTPQQRGRLGGLAAAGRLSKAERQERSAKGADALRAGFANESAYHAHMLRLSLRARGYDVEVER